MCGNCATPPTAWSSAWRGTSSALPGKRPRRPPWSNRWRAASAASLRRSCAASGAASPAPPRPCGSPRPRFTTRCGSTASRTEAQLRRKSYGRSMHPADARWIPGLHGPGRSAGGRAKLWPVRPHIRPFSEEINVIQKKFALAALTLALAAPGLYAAEGQAAANPVDPGSVAALKRMGTFLQTLQRFEVKSDRTTESVLADGQKLQNSAVTDTQVQRPNKLRLVSWRGDTEKELVYDGKTVTLYTPATKYYASAETEPTIGGMIGQIRDKFGIETPVSDLFIWGTDAAPVDKIESAMNAGQDMVGDHVCNHYAFRQEQFDWQLWIRAGEIGRAS